MSSASEAEESPKTIHLFGARQFWPDSCVWGAEQGFKSQFEQRIPMRFAAPGGEKRIRFGAGGETRWRKKNRKKILRTVDLGGEILVERASPQITTPRF